MKLNVSHLSKDVAPPPPPLCFTYLSDLGRFLVQDFSSTTASGCFSEVTPRTGPRVGSRFLCRSEAGRFLLSGTACWLFIPLWVRLFCMIGSSIGGGDTCEESLMEVRRGLTGFLTTSTLTLSSSKTSLPAVKSAASFPFCSGECKL